MWLTTKSVFQIAFIWINTYFECISEEGAFTLKSMQKRSVILAIKVVQNLNVDGHFTPSTNA